MSAPADAPCSNPLLAQLRAQQQGGYGAPAHTPGLTIYALPLFSGSKDEHLAQLDELERTGIICGHSYIDASSGPALAVVDAKAPA